MSSTPVPAWQAKLEKGTQQAIAWIMLHQERFWTVVGLTVLIALALVFMVRHRTQLNEEAWNQLGVAQGHLFQGKHDETRKALDDWNTRFQGTSAEAYARFMKADLLMQTTQYTEAAQIYADLSAAARPAPLRPLALAARVNALEIGGDVPAARAAAQQFMDTYPDHFMAGPTLLAQARLAEVAKDPAAAVAVYDRFVLLYPQSPWTAQAQARVKALGGSPASSAPPVPTPSPSGG